MREKGRLASHTIVPVPVALGVPPKSDGGRCRQLRKTDLRVLQVISSNYTQGSCCVDTSVSKEEVHHWFVTLYCFKDDPK